jgi:sugar lactone lactonase YvrE
MINQDIFLFMLVFQSFLLKTYFLMKIFRFLMAVAIFSSCLFFIGCDIDEIEGRPFLNADKTAYDLKADAGRDSLLITSNTSWTVSGLPDWLTIDPMMGQGNTKVYLYYSGNITDVPKTAILSFNSVGGTARPLAITINQSSDIVIHNSFIKAAGGTIITILGSGFSNIAAENSVKFNGVAAPVQSATNSKLMVTVPMKVGSGKIEVSVNAKPATRTIEFIYDWMGIVTTLAGSTPGHADGTGSVAKFGGPAGLDMDAAGNLYVADYGNNKVRKITPAGVVTTLPGRIPNWNNQNGPNTDFNLPSDVAVDDVGNVFVAEYNSHIISKITPTGEVSVLAGGIRGFADGTTTAAQFDSPSGIAADASGNVYVTDAANHKVRKITPAGVVTTLAGNSKGYKDDTGSAAQFNSPFSVAKDAFGNLFITDSYNRRIRKVTPAGIVTTFAGNGIWGMADGLGLAAQFENPTEIAVNAAGNIYLSDAGTKVRWITPAGKVTTVAGYVDSITHEPIEFRKVLGIAVDGTGHVYVSDYYNAKIYKIVIQ